MWICLHIRDYFYHRTRVLCVLCVSARVFRLNVASPRTAFRCKSASKAKVQGKFCYPKTPPLTQSRVIRSNRASLIFLSDIAPFHRDIATFVLRFMLRFRSPSILEGLFTDSLRRSIYVRFVESLTYLHLRSYSSYVAPVSRYVCHYVYITFGSFVFRRVTVSFLSGIVSVFELMRNSHRLRLVVFVFRSGTGISPIRLRHQSDRSGSIPATIRHSSVYAVL